MIFEEIAASWKQRLSRQRCMKILITGVCGFVGSALADACSNGVEGISRSSGMDNLMRPGSGDRIARGSNGWASSSFTATSARASDIDASARRAIGSSTPPPIPACWPASPGPEAAAGSSNIIWRHSINVLEYCQAAQGRAATPEQQPRLFDSRAGGHCRCGCTTRRSPLDAAAPLPGGLTADGIGVDFSTAAPVSLYGATKLASEIMALEYGAAFDFPVWINRCGVLAGAGQFGTPDQGIFAFWVNAHLRRRPLRYIGFDGTGIRSRDCFHPRDLAALLIAQMRDGPRGRPSRLYAGGGPANAMSLAQLTAWCDERFGAHPPAVDPQPRHVRHSVGGAGQLPQCRRDFGWQHRDVPARQFSRRSRKHARDHPDWLEVEPRMKSPPPSSLASRFNCSPS